jgi:hypothetical protein
MRNIDQGLGATGLIGLALALVIVVSIGAPMVLSADQIKLADWLGFAGSLFGGAFTLGAAYVAWLAVQGQIAEQRRSAEAQRRDGADQRLSLIISAVMRVYNEYAQIAATHNEDRMRQFEDFEAFRYSPDLLMALIDPVVGHDREAINFLLHAMRNRAGALIGKVDAERGDSYGKIVPDLYREVLDGLTRRREVMQQGTVDDLMALRLINLPRHKRKLNQSLNHLSRD